ncbi:MAG TPA: ABC-F family ATP-binding cassette domain-containing protein, partial [Candidatus Limnocylindrales bacterium]|nr:ABC-F family ATP-binding cassette domain-containing protein [Candidatus Limnocylindrales bacterium]
HLTVNHAGREIFHDLTWAIGARDKIGLVGPNGAGKSSLIKAITGEIIPVQGTITAMRGVSVGYLAQEVCLPAGTLFEAACVPSPELADALAQAAALEARLGDPAVYNNAEALQAVLEDHDLALMRCERLDADRQVSRVRELLSKLGFTAADYDLPVEALSGGQTKLVALARLAAWSPDVLLLDEPDNHLDLHAKTALEGFLRDHRGAVVLVSHDRYLLDAVVTQIAELENGAISAYVGNYSAYTVERELRRIRQQQLYQTQQRELARIEAMIREWELKAKADLSERYARQAASRRKMLARMEERGELIDAVSDRSLMALQIEGGRGSTKAVTLEDVTMGFGGDLLFLGVNLLIRHGERVGLIGHNGAGKSVLFKLILGELQPLDGMIKAGPSTRIGYYAQRHETLSAWNRRTPIELVRDAQPMSEGAAVHKLLRFAFTYEQARQPIATFSGGERSRLQLLALVLKQPNLLLLDEPTNNLDIASSEVLESALEEFEGAILTISHDRYFLDRIVDRIVELEDGGLQEYTGGYGDYVRQKAARKTAAEAEAAAQRAKAARRQKRS